MINTTKRRSLMAVAGFLAIGATQLSAQTEQTTIIAPYAPQFFMAVIGGVLLAIGFQILLTSISVASGISLVGDIEDKGMKPGKGDDASEKDKSSDDDSISPIYKITSAIGIWTLVTASLSLFFASLLAVRLSAEGTVWMGITLGLIIWASFFAIMTYIEIRSVSTLIGGVFSAALGGLRASFTAARGIFGKSPEDRVMNLASDVTGRLREELSEALDDSHITGKINEYVDQLKPKPIDFEKVKSDLMDMFRDVKVEEHSDVRHGHVDREMFLKFAKDQPHIKREDLNKLGNVFDEVKQAIGSSEKGSGKVEALADKFAPGDREKIEQYLKQTGREEVDPERIKQDIDEMFEDPAATPGIITERLKQFDRETVVSLLSQRDDISHEKAEKIVSSVEKAIAFVQEKAMKAKDKEGRMVEAGQGQMAALGAMPKHLEDRLRNYMADIGRPEFNYDRIRLDFERIFHHPKDTPTILKARMKMYDRDSLVALLSSREGVSEADAERMVEKIEEARERVIRKVERIEDEVRHQITESKRLALHEAENVRKASASAAWWMVGTAVGSGAFAALGAALAVTL